MLAPVAVAAAVPHPLLMLEPVAPRWKRSPRRRSPRKTSTWVISLVAVMTTIESIFASVILSDGEMVVERWMHQGSV